MMTSRKDLLHRLLLPLDSRLAVCMPMPSTDLEDLYVSQKQKKAPGGPHILRELQLQEYQDTDQWRCPTICVRIDS
jgi:hypothetical protein